MLWTTLGPILPREEEFYCIVHVCVSSHVHVCVSSQVVYTAALLGMSLYGMSNPYHLPSDRLVAYFSMIHVAVWAIVGTFDRCL